MEDSARRATANKRLHVHQRVSGAVGEYIQGPTKRRRRQRLFGQIISAVGEKKYLVRFDNGSEKECSSALLRVEKSHESLPPDVPVHVPENIQHRVDVADAEEEVADQEDEEPLAASPEDEEMEAALEDADGMDDNPPNATTEDAEPPNGMPGQIPTESDQPLGKDYAAIKKQALEKIQALVGEKVTIKTRNNGTMEWTVVSSNDPEDVIPEKEDCKKYGMKGFHLSHYKKSEIFCILFLKLLFKDWTEKVKKMNAVISASSAKCRAFTEKDFSTGLGIMIGAAEFAKRGSDLFSVKDQAAFDGEDEEENWASLCPDPHFERFMSFSRWKEFRKIFPDIFSDNDRKETDPWYQFSGAIDEFNELRQELICGSRWISADETMCAWRPRKTATGGLPNISFIIRKPEPLGKNKLLQIITTKGNKLKHISYVFV